MALCRLPSPGRRFGCAGTQKELRPGLWRFENKRRRNRPTGKTSARLSIFSSIESYQTRFTPFPALRRRYRTTGTEIRCYRSDPLNIGMLTLLEKHEEQPSDDR